MARSKELTAHLGRLSRSQVRGRRGLFKGLKTSEVPTSEFLPPYTEKQIGGENNGGTRRIPVSKASRYYPAEDVRHPRKSRKVTRIAKLRSSIVPGTVLILLAGRYAGKRVVFLKQLSSGLLLVTGPFKINGVPLRRVNQAYVIATATNIDIGDHKVDDKINDDYFSKKNGKESRSAEEEFFADGKPKEKEPFPETKSSDQKEVDSVIIKSIKESKILAKYLKATWGLNKGEHPHRLFF